MTDQEDQLRQRWAALRSSTAATATPPPVSAEDLLTSLHVPHHDQPVNEAEEEEEEEGDVSIEIGIKNVNNDQVSRYTAALDNIVTTDLLARRSSSSSSKKLNILLDRQDAQQQQQLQQQGRIVVEFMARPRISLPLATRTEAEEEELMLRMMDEIGLEERSEEKSSDPVLLLLREGMKDEEEQDQVHFMMRRIEDEIQLEDGVRQREQEEQEWMERLTKLKQFVPPSTSTSTSAQPYQQQQQLQDQQEAAAAALGPAPSMDDLLEKLARSNIESQH